MFTLYYSEVVLYSMPELQKKNEDGISILFYLQKIYPGIPFLFILHLYIADCSLQFSVTEYQLPVTYNDDSESLLQSNSRSNASSTVSSEDCSSNG